MVNQSTQAFGFPVNADDVFTAPKIVGCKDRKRRFDYPSTSFTFLGFTFRTRSAATKDRTSVFAAFLPAMGHVPEAHTEYQNRQQAA